MWLLNTLPPCCPQATGYTEGPEVAAVQQTTTTVPVVAAVPSGEAPRGQVGETYRQGEEATCAQEYFTKVGPCGVGRLRGARARSIEQTASLRSSIACDVGW
jgi:hypothetical protein